LERRLISLCTRSNGLVEAILLMVTLEERGVSGEVNLGG
jgi:hypothetical protein